MSALSTRSLRSLLAVGALATVLTLAAPVTAQAHDQLLSSTPAADDRLTFAPESVELVYSSEVIALGVIALVVDDSGRDWVEAEPTVDGTTVTVPLADGLDGGDYRIQWRVVSSDGHAISGEIPFAVELAAAAPTSTKGASPSASATESAPVAASSAPSVLAETSDASAAQADNTASSGPTWTIIVVGGAMAVLAVAAGLVWRRRNIRDIEPRDHG